MNEAQRLVYLEALGIQQWVAKAALPNAKTTEFYVEDFSDTDAVNAATEIIESTSPQAIKQTVVVPVFKGEESKREKPKDEMPEQKTTVLELKTAMPACALQIQGKRGQYLLMADLQDPKGKINTREQNLLNNISKSINSLLENTSTNPIAPEQFKWPMFESHFKADHIDQSAQAAKESAQAFLFSHIKRSQLPLVIALGERAHFLLGLDAPEGGINISPNFGKTQFILAASLAEMMQSNAHSMKAELWKNLVKYFV